MYICIYIYIYIYLLIWNLIRYKYKHKPKSSPWLCLVAASVFLLQGNDTFSGFFVFVVFGINS